MNPKQLVSDLDQGKLSAVYLLHGEEPFIANAMLRRILSATQPEGDNDMDRELLDETCNASQILSAAQTLPWLSQKRVVIVRDFAGLTGKKEKKADASLAADEARLEELIKNANATTVLIFVCHQNADKRTKWYKLLQSKACEVNCDPITSDDATMWLVRQAKDRGMILSSIDAKSIVDMVGCDLWHLYHELDKLSSLVGKDNPVTAQDIASLVSKNTAYHVYQMIGLIVTGKKDMALSMLQEMFRQGESGVFLLSVIARQLRMMLFVSRVTRKEAGDIAVALSVPPFAVQKAMDQVKYLKSQQMEQLVQMASDLDWAFKSGQIRDENLCVERLVLSILENVSPVSQR